MDEFEQPKINHLLNRRVFFGVLFLLIITLFLVLIWPYLNVIIFSLTIVMLLRPVYTRIYNWKWVKEFRASKGLATMLTTTTFILLVAIPVMILLILTVSQVRALASNISLEEFVLEDFLNTMLLKIEGLATLRSGEFDRQAFLEQVSTAIGQVIT
jgi:predicted PurR-regulated permease PerM